MTARGAIDLSTIKVVTWDVDGTLYSTQGMKVWIAWRFLFEVMAGRGTMARRDLSMLRRYRSAIHAARSRGGDLVDVLPPAERRMVLDAEYCWYGRAIERLGPRPGVRDVLDWFAARRIPQVIVSDYDPAYKLELLRLGKYFTSNYVGEALGSVKPSPKTFARVVADFNIAPGELLHIGDRSYTDGVAAELAGAKCLIFARDFRNFQALASALGP